MSAFTHGFNHGFMHGMLNNMLGVGWCNPFMCWNPTPMFFTPSYNFGGFYRYQTPMSSFDTSVFNIGAFAGNNSLSFGQLPEFDYSWKNSSYLKNNSDLSYGWGDLFVKRKSSQVNNDKDSGKYSDDVTEFTNDATELKNKWSKINPNLSQEFYEKVVQISDKLNCSANDLMALMNSESGLDSTAENKIGAVGLIQFLPKTAEGLGTTTQELKAMTPEQQLDFVEKFLVEAKKTAGYAGDAKVGPGTLYAFAFLPSYAKNDILAEKDNDPYEYYAQNAGLDLNNDGKITKADLARRVKDKQA